MKTDDYKALIALCENHGWKEIGSNVNMVYISGQKERTQWSPAVEQAIEEVWAKKIAHAQAAGKRAPTNGEKVACLEARIKFHGDKCSIGLEVAPTDYKHYTGIIEISPQNKIWIIGTAGIITYQENGQRNFVFASRNSHIKNVGGTIETPPGGYLEPEFIPKNLRPGERTSHVFIDNLCNEFNEEIGLSRDHIQKIVSLGVRRLGDYHNPVTDQLQRFSDVSIDYWLTVETKKSELCEAFKKSSKYGGEHAAQFFVPEKDLIDFIRANQEKLTPRTKADLRQFALRILQEE